MNGTELNDATAPRSVDQQQACSAGWTCGDAPKDGNLYVALGRMVGADEYGGHSTPFLSHVQWKTGDWSGWVDEHGMAISSDIDDTVHIDHWCFLPNASHQAPAALDAAMLPDASSRLPACDCSPSNLKTSNTINE